MIMLARFPDPQPRFVQEPEPDWWLIAIRALVLIILLVILYMGANLYLGFDPLHIIVEEAAA